MYQCGCVLRELQRACINSSTPHKLDCRVCSCFQPVIKRLRFSEQLWLFRQTIYTTRWLAALHSEPRGAAWKQDKRQLWTVSFCVCSPFSTKSHQHSWQQTNRAGHGAIEKDLKALRRIVPNPIHPLRITVYHCLMDKTISQSSHPIKLIYWEWKWA